MTLIAPRQGITAFAHAPRPAAIAPAFDLALPLAPARAAANAYIASRTIGAVEGVELLANPRLPDTVQEGRWAVPATGSLFDVAPNPAVSLEHVDQGRLGDCWYVAGMGAIARNDPAYLQGMIRESGEHVIVDFPQRSVAVTKELPLRGMTDEPQFAGRDQSDPVYWPAYLEKAQAALDPAGYQSLKGGKASTAFLHLLGVQPMKVPRSAGGPMTDALQALREGTPVVLSTRGRRAAPPALAARMDAINVHRNHAYVPVASGIDGSGADTVTLFNPWGHLHPTRPVTRDELVEMVVRTYTPSTERSYPLSRAARAAS